MGAARSFLARSGAPQRPAPRAAKPKPGSHRSSPAWHSGQSWLRSLGGCESCSSASSSASSSGCTASRSRCRDSARTVAASDGGASTGSGEDEGGGGGGGGGGGAGALASRAGTSSSACCRPRASLGAFAAVDDVAFVGGPGGAVRSSKAAMAALAAVVAPRPRAPAAVRAAGPAAAAKSRAVRSMRGMAALVALPRATRLLSTSGPVLRGAEGTGGGRASRKHPKVGGWPWQSGGPGAMGPGPILNIRANERCAGSGRGAAPAGQLCSPVRDARLQGPGLLCRLLTCRDYRGPFSVSPHFGC